MRSVVALLLIAALAAPSWAERTDAEYGPVDKLGRGLANVTAGVLALPEGMIRQTQQDGISGVPVGFGMGLANTVARELVGVYEVVTFMLPPPDDYAPALEPAYPWEFFSETGEVRQARTAGAEARAEALRAEQVRLAQCLSRTDVRHLQRRLDEMGYELGPVDGVIGPRTQSALREFQRDRNLEVSGRVGVETIAALEPAQHREGGSATSGVRGSGAEPRGGSEPTRPEREPGFEGEGREESGR
jgi:putative exosortase-associated protein (TIGR04073 family)